MALALGLTSAICSGKTSPSVLTICWVLPGIGILPQNFDELGDAGLLRVQVFY
jgi:hypothetical protein